MSVYKKRIDAMKALVAGSFISASAISDINNEFEEVYRIEKINPLKRRRLFQVLHSTRALDTFLKNFTINYGIRKTEDFSLGKYLDRLESHGNTKLNKLSGLTKNHYKSKIVNVRNFYMHEAGKFPSNDAEVQSLISEMQACLATVTLLSK